jgi:RimJ/RimL family protein N-acetyltransferase
MKIIRIANGNIPKYIIELADKDPEITGYVHPEKDIFRYPIKDGEKVVGFFSPRKEDKEWRVGAIFVLPEYRGKGLSSKALKEFFYGDNLPAYAHVGIDNFGSQKAFERAGFFPEDSVRIDEDGWENKKWNKT